MVSKFSAGRGLLHIGIAALAFVLTCAGLKAVRPFPDLGVAGPKLRFFNEHQDDFDTVFVGSSRINHQISPSIFDRIMGGAGHPTRTFNLGMNGMLPLESSFVLERLLKTKPRRLKWVFIELDDLETSRVPGAEGSRRYLYWHDWKRTLLAFREVIDAGRQGSELALPKVEVRDLLFFHGTLFAKKSYECRREE